MPQQPIDMASLLAHVNNSGSNINDISLDQAGNVTRIKGSPFVQPEQGKQGGGQGKVFPTGGATSGADAQTALTNAALGKQVGQRITGADVGQAISDVNPPADQPGILGSILGKFGIRPRALNDPLQRAGLSRTLANVGAALQGNEIPDPARSSGAAVQGQALREGQELTGLAGAGITPGERADITAEGERERLLQLRESESITPAQQAAIDLNQAAFEADLKPGSFTAETRPIGSGQVESGSFNRQTGRFERDSTADDPRLLSARAATSGRSKGLQRNIEPVEGGQQRTVFDPESGRTVATGPVIPDPTAPFSDGDRDVMTERLIDDIRATVGNVDRRFRPDTKANKKDIAKVLRSGKVPKEWEVARAQIDAYRILVNREDVTGKSKATRSKFRRDVADAMSNISPELEEEGSTGGVGRSIEGF